MAKAKSDNYQTITDNFVAALEAMQRGERERLPWQRDWGTLGKPRNGFSNREYTGMNTFLLSLTGFSDPRWTTSAAITKNAGKGYKLLGNATPVTYWNTFRVTEKNEKGETVEGTRPYLKLFWLYNFEQIVWPEGYEPPAIQGADTYDTTLEERTEAASAWLDAYMKADGIPVTHGGDRAFYRPSAHSIQLPELERFRSAEGYVATKAHESVHSTGKALKRDMGGGFGSMSYAKEELVAELGAAFLCADYGINGSKGLDDNHLAYLEGWIRALRGNSKALFTAHRLAKEAAERIHKLSGFVAQKAADEDAV